MTPRQVIELSPTKSTFSDRYIQNIGIIERNVFREHFNYELYENLLDDLAYYLEDEFKLAKTYHEGDTVLYQGSYYTSLVDNNNKLPTENTWKIADKFNDPCYNELWCMGLNRFLAYNIILPAIRYSTYQAGAKGVVMHAEHGDTAEKTVDHRSFEQYLRQLKSDTESMLDDINHYMDNSDCKDKFFIFDDECGKVKRPRSGLRRILMT
ncbi:MAG TPA: hypothetical protein VK031_04765 [Tissierellaceae bacterium]|nr:hypothetical protein [Tissierellaceae bacterium]